MPNLHDGTIEIITREKDDENGKILSGTVLNIRELIEMMDKPGAPLEKLNETREKIRKSKEPKEIKDEREQSAVNSFCHDIVVGSTKSIIEHIEEDVELSAEEKAKIAIGIEGLTEGSFRIYLLKKESGWYDRQKEKEKEKIEDVMNRLSKQVGNA
jgi:hypothetical protein